MRSKIHAAALCALVAGFAGNSLGAIASKTTGKAATSANLSTNPTIRQQQLLCDPAGPDEPLILSYAKLDVKIHLDTPIGYNAQDIIQSIQVNALAPHFQPVGTMPFYQTDGGSSGITFNGRDILISNFTVQWNTDNLPPAGEVDHATVDVQYNNVLPTSIYNNVLATYTVTTNPTSEIRGVGETTRELFTFDSDHIDPATDKESLGVPEPTTLGGAMVLGAMALVKRRRRH